MSWSFTAHRGSANNKVSGATLAVSPSGTIVAGAVLIAVCVSDNIATGGGQTSNHVVTDFLGNSWKKIREQSNADVAAAGITLSVWICQLDTQILTTDSVVFGMSAAVTAKAIGLYEYAIANGNVPAVIGSASSEQDATTAPTVTLSNLLSQSYALFGVVGRENDTAGTYTQDTDYNDRTKFGSTGGGGATNVSCVVGDRLATLTSDTFAPTALSASADVATILVTLKEVSPLKLTVSDVRQINGRVYVLWSNGEEDEYASLADALDQRDALLASGATTLKRLAISRYLRIDPTGSNPSILIGHSIRYTDDLNGMVLII